MEHLDTLKSIIQDDIITSIKINVEEGNITPNDARRLRLLAKRLFDYLYSHYEEMEEINVLTDESLILDIDIMEMEFEKKLEERTNKVTKDVTDKVTKDVTDKVTKEATLNTIQEMKVLGIPREKLLLTLQKLLNVSAEEAHNMLDNTI